MASEGKNKKKKKTQVQMKLIPSLPAKLGRIYSNYIEVSHSPWDFTIRFCDAPPGSDVPRLRKGNKLEIPTIIEVIIPANLISGLINALTDQNEKYSKLLKETHDEDK